MATGPPQLLLQRLLLPLATDAAASKQIKSNGYLQFEGPSFAPISRTAS